MTPGLTAAREALAEHDRSRCGILFGPDDAPGMFRCSLALDHDGEHAAETRPWPHPNHLRDALAEGDRLTADIDGARDVYEKTWPGGEALSAADLAVRMSEAWCDAIDARNAALLEVDRLTAELAEALATLANERGEGEPPSGGWEWNPHARFWHCPGATVHWSDTGRCWWWSDSPEPYRHHDDRRPRTSARAAMRAADAAKESR